MIKRTMTISANNLSTRDYKGIVKGAKQIPLIYFEPEPQDGGSDKASVVRPAAATTQSELPKARNSFIQLLTFLIQLLTFDIQLLTFAIQLLTFDIQLLTFVIKLLTFVLYSC